MPYAGTVVGYDYLSVYSAEPDNDIESWFDTYQPPLVAAPRTTVDPIQLYERPDAFEFARSYDSEQRHHNANRNGTGGAQLVPTYAVPQTLYERPSRVISEARLESQPRQELQVLFEYRAQTSRSQRHYCDYETCVDPNTGRRKSVSRRADLKRHVLSVHGKPHIDCEYKKCLRRGEDGFCRQDHYQEHLRGYHGQELPRQERRRNS